MRTQWGALGVTAPLGWNGRVAGRGRREPCSQVTGQGPGERVGEMAAAQPSSLWATSRHFFF